MSVLVSEQQGELAQVPDIKTIFHLLEHNQDVCEIFISKNCLSHVRPRDELIFYIAGEEASVL